MSAGSVEDLRPWRLSGRIDRSRYRSLRGDLELVCSLTNIPAAMLLSAEFCGDLRSKIDTLTFGQTVDTENEEA
jgi:hypothetical protein